MGLFPAWRIASMQLVEPWGWHELDAADMLHIRGRLGLFETMTWKEILLDSKKQNHSIEKWKICSEAQKHLEDIGYGDLEKIVSLRLSARERVWGVLNEGVLTVLWWDPDHTVYPTEPKS